MLSQLKSKFIFLLFLVVLTVLVVSRFANLQTLARNMVQGLWMWILAAVAVHLVYFLLSAALYKYSFATVGVKNRTLELFPVLMSSLAVNAVAPTGGAGGAAVFVNYNVRHGKSGGRTAIGVVLDLVADLVTLVPYIIWALVFLIQTHTIKIYEILGVAAYLVFIIGLGGILLVAYFQEDELKELFAWFQRQVNRIGDKFKHPDLLKEGWSERSASEFVSGAHAISEHPRSFLRMLILGLGMHMVNLVGLYLLFIAYQQPVDWGTMTAGFALGIVFFVVTVIPQGVGAVEGIMGLVFIAMGVPKVKAITIVVVFRGLNFWLPLALGLIFMHYVTQSGKKASSE